MKFIKWFIAIILAIVLLVFPFFGMVYAVSIIKETWLYIALSVSFVGSLTFYSRKLEEFNKWFNSKLK